MKTEIELLLLPLFFLSIQWNTWIQREDIKKSLIVGHTNYQCHYGAMFRYCSRGNNVYIDKCHWAFSQILLADTNIIQIINIAVNILLSGTRIMDSGHKFPFKCEEVKSVFNM